MVGVWTVLTNNVGHSATVALLFALSGSTEWKGFSSDHSKGVHHHVCNLSALLRLEVHHSYVLFQFDVWKQQQKVCGGVVMLSGQRLSETQWWQSLQPECEFIAWGFLWWIVQRGGESLENFYLRAWILNKPAPGSRRGRLFLPWFRIPSADAPKLLTCVLGFFTRRI